MEDLMKKGEFKAAKILPLVGKYLEKAAEQGDALKIRLQQLEVIENRMATSWTKLQNKIYETGGEKGLKGLYKTLDFIFRKLESQDLVGGGFLSGFFDSATKSLEYIWNLGQNIKGYLLEMGLTGVNGEMFGKAAYWLTIAASMNALSKFFSLLLSGGIIGKVWQLVAAVAGLATAEGAAANNAGKMTGGLLGKFGKIAGKVGLPLTFTAAAYEAWSINKELTKDMTEAQQQAAQLDPTNNPTILSGQFNGYPNGVGGRNINQPIQIISQGAIDVNLKMNDNAKDFVQAEVTRQIIQPIIPTSINPKH